MAPSRPVSGPESSSTNHVKQGSGPAARRIRREADTVRRVANPSVVRLLSFHDDAATDTATATYSRVPGGDLTQWHPTNATQIAALFAAAAQAVHELHRCGMAHGSIDARHILIDEHGRPVLCGLADARTISDVEVSADLRALSSMLLASLDELEHTSSGSVRRLSGDHRAQRRLRKLASAISRRGDHSPADLVDFGAALARLGTETGAKQWSSPEPSGESSGPTVVSLTDRADHLDRARSLPSEELPPTRRWRARPVGPRYLHDVTRRHRVQLISLLAGGAIIFGIVLAVLVTQRGDRADPSAVEARTTNTPSPAINDPAPGIDSATMPVEAPTIAIETGFGCAGLVLDGRCATIELGAGIVQVGDHRFAVGSPTDHLVIGDWDCDGVPTVAVIRRRTGEVFLFDRWSLDEPIPGRAVALLHDAGIPLVVERANGCDDLQVPYGDDVWTFSGAAT